MNFVLSEEAIQLGIPACLLKTSWPHLKLHVNADFITEVIPSLTDIANFSMKYFILRKVCTDDGGMKQLYHVQVNKPWHSIYLQSSR